MTTYAWAEQVARAYELLPSQGHGRGRYVCDENGWALLLPLAGSMATGPRSPCRASRSWGCYLSQVDDDYRPNGAGR